MKTPFAKDSAFLQSLTNAATAADHFHCWWLGQSTFLIDWDGHRFIFDPYLSDSLTRKYADTDKPHVRVTEQVIAPEKLTGLSFATSSHNHTDHLDAETLHGLRTSNPDLGLVLPAANVDFAAERLGWGADELTPIDAGGSVECGPFTVHAVPAAHNALDTDDQGRHKYIGFVVTFGPFAVHHCGDSLRYDGMAEALADFKIDLTLLPINGNKPERRVSGNLDGREAAQLAKDIGAGCVVPCHYDLFEFNTADPDELFVPACEKLEQNYQVLENGEALRIDHW